MIPKETELIMFPFVVHRNPRVFIYSFIHLLFFFFFFFENEYNYNEKKKRFGQIQMFMIQKDFL